ncbi:MAG: hypothetical protein KF787_11400 [Phycisphaeraceae bacterium]|nr:hypothetical protein [Phycisphaerae bacterium]MBX3393240.1 hypothetical protein [Phycisphaeraceae bacterium]
MDRLDGVQSGFTLRLAQSYEPERFTAARPPAGRRPDPAPLVRSTPDVNAVRPSIRSAGIDRLVAGRVIDTTARQEHLGPARSAVFSASRGDTLPMHLHPADRNSAATGVSVGRSIDVTA